MTLPVHEILAYPAAILVLDPDLIMLGATNEYYRMTLTTPEQIEGKYVFDVFTDNPEAGESEGVVNLRESLDYVKRHCKAHTMPAQRYDIQRPKVVGGGYEVRYWQITNSPIMGDGRLQGIINRVEDVTLQEVAKSHQVQTQGQFAKLLLAGFLILTLAVIFAFAHLYSELHHVCAVAHAVCR